MCTIEQLEKALEENNIKRNKNLDNKLQDLKHEIFEKVDTSINKRLAHNQTAPETREIFNKIKDNCAETTQKYNLIQQSMSDELTNISQYMAEDKVWKKEFAQSMLDKLDKKADLKDVEDMEATIEKLKQFRWQTLAIITAGWALFEKFL